MQPFKQKKISNFHSSLYILHACHQKIETLFHDFTNDQLSGPKYYKSPTLLYISRYLIMEAASFLDEYQTHFTYTLKAKYKAPRRLIEKKYRKRVDKLKLILAPVMKQIYRWKDIKTYRNSYVGHTNRGPYKKNRAKLVIDGQEVYNIPRRYWEFQLLRDLFHIAFGVITQEFNKEFVDADFKARTLKPVTGTEKDVNKMNTQLNEMIDKFQKMCKQERKTYTLHINGISYPDLQTRLTTMPEFIHVITKEHEYIRKNKMMQSAPY